MTQDPWEVQRPASASKHFVSARPTTQITRRYGYVRDVLAGEHPEQFFAL